MVHNDGKSLNFKMIRKKKEEEEWMKKLFY